MLGQTAAPLLVAASLAAKLVHAAPAPAASILSSVTSAVGSAASAVTSDAASLTSEAASAFQSAFPSAVLGVPDFSEVEQALGIDNSSYSSSNVSALFV